MDYDDLINKNQGPQANAIPSFFANIGTTVRGAVDNIAEIQKRIAALGIPREDYYLHADAALSGMILPFVEDPQPFTFADGIDSIGVSGHKMIGSPIPCGIVVAKKANVDRISVEIDYISAHDKNDFRVTQRSYPFDDVGRRSQPYRCRMASPHWSQPQHGEIRRGSL